MKAHSKVVREEREDRPEDEDGEQEDDRAADALRRAERVPEARVGFVRCEEQMESGRGDDENQGGHLSRRNASERKEAKGRKACSRGRSTCCARARGCHCMKYCGTHSRK